jgi:plasmid stabilization system protein ParE
MTYSLHRGAEQDLFEAAQFYRREGGSRLASRFLSEFERVAQLMFEFPGIGTPTEGLRRVHPLRNFPYSVIYRVTDGQIRILVVRGQLRDPEYGDSRR